MNILITGGCGFLGQHLTKQLLQQYPKVKIKLLDLRDSPKPLYSFKKEKSVSYCLGKDITHYDSIKDDFIKVDVVFHLAGIVAFGVKDKDKLFKVNIEGAKKVFQASVTNKVKRFIHVSSVAALGYKNDSSFLVNEKYKFNWKIAWKYKKYYMLSKHLADKYLLEQNHNNNLNINLNIAYPGLMLGPGDYNNSVKLLQSFHKIPFNTPGGTNILDVRDVAKGLVSVLKNGKRGEHYLLSGYNLTFKGQNKIISKVLGVKPPRRTLPKFSLPLLYKAILMIENRAKETPKLTSDNLHSSFKFRYFDNNKAKKDLSWQPEISYQRTIEDTYQWMKKENLI